MSVDTTELRKLIRDLDVAKRLQLKKTIREMHDPAVALKLDMRREAKSKLKRHGRRTFENSIREFTGAKPERLDRVASWVGSKAPMWAALSDGVKIIGGKPWMVILSKWGKKNVTARSRKGGITFPSWPMYKVPTKKGYALLLPRYRSKGRGENKRMVRAKKDILVATLVKEVDIPKKVEFDALAKRRLPEFDKALLNGFLNGFKI